jgi:hypothetical protein
MRFLAVVVLTASLALLSAGLGVAQAPFQITFHRAPDEPTSLVVAGTVSNDGSRDVVDVWVTADALNAQGRRVGRGTAFVASLLRGRASTAFTVKLPRADEAHSFRVFVSSFRYLSAAESP